MLCNKARVTNAVVLVDDPIRFEVEGSDANRAWYYGGYLSIMHMKMTFNG